MHRLGNWMGKTRQEAKVMSFLLNQIALAFWNLINSRIDAYRILKHKGIAHGINLVVYAVAVGVVCWIAKYGVKEIVLCGVSAFFNRQLSFDIPLNKRRKLPWYYQSTANPPAAWWDKVERKVFGVDYDGKKIVVWYSFLFVLSVIPELFK